MKYGKISGYPVEDGVIDVLERLGSTKLFVAGHEHINCFKIKCRGVGLLYSLKTGKGCYWLSAMNGGTAIRVTGDGKFGTEHIFVEPRFD